MTAERSSRPPRGAFERAVRFCRGRRLFAPGDRVLVGSGSGAASLGALGFLRLAQLELGLGDVAVAAVDFGGEDDAEAVADVGRFARLLGATFHAVSAEEPRRRPLPALAALARREGYNRIALGHTRDDAVVRVLAAIARGREVTAVRPLAARRRDGVVRPLLELRDAEALELARTAGIEPTMLPPDASTARRPTLEQRLRASVLPRLRVEVAGADAALLAHATAVSRLVREVRTEARRRLEERARFGPTGVELPCVPPGQPALASALAREALARVGVSPTAARTAVAPLARLLGSDALGAGASNPREVLLGPGIVATYLPQTRVVALRVLRAPRRAPDEVSG